MDSGKQLQCEGDLSRRLTTQGCSLLPQIWNQASRETLSERKRKEKRGEELQRRSDFSGGTNVFVSVGELHEGKESVQRV